MLKETCPKSYQPTTQLLYIIDAGIDFAIEAQFLNWLQNWNSNFDFNFEWQQIQISMDSLWIEIFSHDSSFFYFVANLISYLILGSNISRHDFRCFLILSYFARSPKFHIQLPHNTSQAKMLNTNPLMIIHHF